MMKLRSFVLVSLPTLTAGALFVLACGDDDDTVLVEDDRDAQVDVARPDANGSIDAGADADADLDSGRQADVVTPQSVSEFASEVEKELCGSLTRCCFGVPGLPNGAPVDGGRFSRDACAALYRNIGFEFSTTGARFVDGGEALIDKDVGRDCLAEIQLLSCNLSGPEMTRVRTKCFDAIVGTRTAGQPCEGSIECARGLFCNPVDGGTCAPLRGDGGACSVFNSGNAAIDSVRSEEACSWRGSGDTRLVCSSFDAGTGEYTARNEWVCRPQVALGDTCNSTVWCRDGICDFNDSVCKSPLEIFTSYCGRVVDAGP